MLNICACLCSFIDYVSILRSFHLPFPSPSHFQIATLCHFHDGCKQTIRGSMLNNLKGKSRQQEQSTFNEIRTDNEWGLYFNWKSNFKLTNWTVRISLWLEQLDRIKRWKMLSWCSFKMKIHRWYSLTIVSGYLDICVCDFLFQVYLPLQRKWMVLM